MSSSSPPSAATITCPQLIQLLSFYPTTLEKTYRQNPRLMKDPKKLSRALEDDRWRYDDLPRIVAKRKRGKKLEVGADGGEKGVDEAWLEKGELEGLVEWKITHGTHRPFLPSLIRQNAPSLVASTTQSAFSSLSTPPSSNPKPYPQLSAALTTLTKPLKGVGPATATLLLSIHNPDSIPFFSDELYAWLVEHKTDLKAGKVKLKYDMKEYQRLYEAWLEFRERLVVRAMKEVEAVEIEKVAFVIGYWDLLSGDDRRSVIGSGASGDEVQNEGRKQDENVEEGEKDGEETRGEGGGDDAEDIEKAEKAEKLPQSTVAEKDGRKRTAGRSAKSNKAVKAERESMDDDTGIRRSKRLKR